MTVPGGTNSFEVRTVAKEEVIRRLREILRKNEELYKISCEEFYQKFYDEDNLYYHCEYETKDGEVIHLNEFEDWYWRIYQYLKITGVKIEEIKNHLHG